MSVLGFFLKKPLSSLKKEAFSFFFKGFFLHKDKALSKALLEINFKKKFMKETKNLFYNLIQALEELEKLTLLLSSQKKKALYSLSPIGAHVRHCIEHIEEFLQGLQKGVINYDKRKRDKALETSPLLALKKLKVLKKLLRSLQEDLKSSSGFEPKTLHLEVLLKNKEESCSKPFVFMSLKTNLSRELLFLFQHTLHHLALLNLLLKEHNLSLHLNSKTPSTLVYEREAF